MKFICSESELQVPIEYLKDLILNNKYKLILLTGEMGAGKTTFTRYLCKSLGSTSIVNSPTYSYMNEYKIGEKNINHFDLYKIKSEMDLHEIGLQETIAGSDISIIEWWEIAKNLIQDNFIEVVIRIHSENLRSIDIKKF